MTAAVRKESFYLTRRALNRQLFNPTAVKHCQFDLHIATAKNCGTHWIKYMLSHVLAERYDLSPPAHTRDDSIVGHTKHPPIYKNIPQIAVTHSHPHYLMRMPALHGTLHLPRYLVLVRDIRAILVSIYEKTRGEYLNKKMGSAADVTFSQYLRGDVTGSKRIEDIWGLIQFFNSWGAAAAQCPERIRIIRYEDLAADTLKELRAICDYIPVPGVTDSLLMNAIQKSSKNEMEKRPDLSESLYQKSINVGDRDYLTWYNSEDNAFVRDTLRRHLKYPLGYEY